MIESHNEAIEYKTSGWDAINDVRKGGGLPWLDFKQGRGDTAMLRLLEIKGTRQKSYKGGEPYQVLEMRVEVHERNGMEIAPEEHMCNPKSAWCIGIKKAINEIAEREGWDGNPGNLGNYAEHVPFYKMRWTRNDDPNTRMGNIDVQILGRIDSKEEDVPFHTEEDQAFEAIAAATSVDELDAIIKLCWDKLTPEQKVNAKARYEAKKSDLTGDLPW
ncbi:MAG: hypothetical protein Unbinned400contig1002_10 [Prokaryotic dsDNA virus sp.]|nr:MAG: hypothetical protein Unbinned400contig1002_10 [Prokaryotic dsDNA virus sp.]|tara:strand:+ start:3523 stop:4173 length:651 start_codon:yes stop_codon:yes gene_type:complete